MASSLTFDPAKGFVALPCDVMNIDMSPGAFRLLVELCRMANRTGECWPSLAQLSARIGRSKAAISGYIAELRETELLETTAQKMANGYNYRLKYCVTFWERWRGSLRKSQAKETVQKEERRVQPVERRVNSKNHSHKKQLPCRSELSRLFLEWKSHAENAPFPDFRGRVDSALIAQTQRTLELVKTEPLTEKVLRNELKAMWCKHSVVIHESELAGQSKALISARTTQKGLEILKEVINKTWQKHWKKAPSSAQFKALLVTAQKQNQEEGMLKMLEQFLKRWEISQKKLQHSGASLSLALNRAA